ncbi:DUF2156 domain-containing protein [Desulfobulbus alkaliphilus]|nr:DUF2156 domain-containing protein [Desulfobulbus alkaliphilus]
MLPLYPQSTPPSLSLRPALHPLFKQVQEGISEFTFANLYLFRRTHQYTLSMLSDGTVVILGRDDRVSFFMLPFGLPQQGLLDRLFTDHLLMKSATVLQAEMLHSLGYPVREDRDNFDYLYQRQDLAALAGRNYHKKRNLVKTFVQSYPYAALPLREEYRGEALSVLDAWRRETGQTGDYEAAREGLEKMEELQLCGGLYRVAERPVAYVLGEESADGTCFVIHFEKALAGFKGLYQFINQSFAGVLPEIYTTINREQDLGDQGLRQAKLSYRPSGFIKKFLARAQDSTFPDSAR